MNLKNIKKYTPGFNIHDIQKKYKLKKVIKLASNENPLGPSLKAIKAIQNSLKSISLYPDSNGFYLRKKLSERFSLDIDNVVLGAGSEGIMATIMRTFLNDSDHILATKNSFIGFRVLANASGKKIDWVPMRDYSYDLSAMLDSIHSKTKVIYLANPDNPTGTYFKKSIFDDFMKNIPNRCLVILDEAYYEYASHLADYPDSMNYRYDNVVTLRTFSKSYGLAGLRVGYGFAHADLISNLMKVKLPFEPSIPGQVAAIAALDDKKHLEESLKLNINQMKRLENILEDLNIPYIPSSANFITLKFNNDKDAKLFADKFLENGVILRHLGSFGLPECVRVTIGSELEMDYFINKLDCIMEYV